MTQPKKRNYLVVEPGARSAQPAAHVVFKARDVADLHKVCGQVVASPPTVLEIELGADLGPQAVQARSALLGAAAASMPNGRVILSAEPGRPLLMAQALADWARSALMGADLRVEVVARDVFAEAA